MRQSPLTTFAIGSRPPGKFVKTIFPFVRYGYTSALEKWLGVNAQLYDAIILNGLWNFTSYGTWRALRKSDVPYFVCPHGMLDPWLRSAKPSRHLLRAAFWTLFEKKVIRDACGIFYACQEERHLARAFVSNLNPNEFIMGYGAQDIVGDPNTQKALFFAKFPGLRGRKLILFLGRIHPKKGLDLLIEALAQCAKQFQDFDLAIVGPDPERLGKQLKDRSAQLGIEARIHWLGMLTGDEKWGALRSANFFVLPSHQENFGIAVVEAMALAVPVLITNKVNIWREVRDNKSGYIVQDNLSGVAHGLNYFCSSTSEQMKTVGKNARSCFERLFDLEKNALEMIGVMETLSYAHRRSNGAG